MTVYAAVQRGAGAFVLAIAVVTMLVAVANTGRAHAAGQPVDDGGIISFGECRVVSLEVKASNAQFTSVFWRFDTAGGGADLGVDSRQVGDPISIGELPANTELILGIVVNDTGKVFKTGPGTRNPDGVVHAIVAGGEVGFEDKALSEANADWDYDDAVLAITSVPCQPPTPRQVSLTVQVDPASTGSGGVGGSGTYDIGVLAHATATPAAGSTFGGWSGDCTGVSTSFGVVMDNDKLCVALFLAEAEATPAPTVAPPIAGPPPVIGINNTRTSPSPASVGDTVIFRIDAELAGVPPTNIAEVLVTFDDTHLAYVGALTSECALFSVGIVCDFGLASSGFSFNLDFTALEVTASTQTSATLGADYDGAGPNAAETAGPALADVAIVDVEGIQLPPLGDGSASFTATGTGSSPLTLVLSVIALGTVTGMGFGLTRRRAAGH